MVEIFNIGKWRIIVDKDNKEINLVNARNKIFTITRTTNYINTNLIPYRIIEHLIIMKLIPAYIEVD